jgi:subtilisin family serine protease
MISSRVRYSRLSTRVAVSVAAVLVLAASGWVAPASAEPRGEPELIGTPLRPAAQEEDKGRVKEGFDEEAPTHGGSGKGQEIDGNYIIIFQPGTKNPKKLAQDLTEENDGKLKYTYEHAIKGFAANLNENKIDGLRRNPNVLSIEKDSTVVAETTQSSATWGLDRIDQRSLPRDNSYTYTFDGSGIHAYIIDTGIRLTHQEFTGRMGNGYDAVTSGGSASDCHGHGTHVAGTVAGTTYGVAKRATVHPVRVLNCSGSGTTSGVIAGIDWVRANATKPAVVNMSLGGGASSALDTAVRNAIASGITFSIAAGNDNANACNYSPARVAEAITVGSTTSSDSRSSFSNYGTCLDLFAPGSSITSAWTSSDTSTNTISGTSMAAPHTAGVAALILDESPSSSPAQVRDKMIAAVTTGKIVSVGSGSPNNLLYSLGGATPPTPPPATGLTNPGFESGSKVGWTESSSGGYQLVTTDRARTGSYSAWLGGYNSGTDQVYQRVTVPSGGKLSYWWRMETTESGSTVYDYLDVRLYDGVTGGFITTLRRWTNASVKNTWSQDTLDVSAHAGKSVYVLFYVRTDSSLASSFFIDDVSLA